MRKLKEANFRAMTPYEASETLREHYDVLDPGTESRWMLRLGEMEQQQRMGGRSSYRTLTPEEKHKVLLYKTARRFLRARDSARAEAVDTYLLEMERKLPSIKKLKSETRREDALKSMVKHYDGFFGLGTWVLLGGYHFDYAPANFDSPTNRYNPLLGNPRAEVPFTHHEWLKSENPEVAERMFTFSRKTLRRFVERNVPRLHGELSEIHGELEKTDVLLSVSYIASEDAIKALKGDPRRIENRNFDQEVRAALDAAAENANVGGQLLFLRPSTGPFQNLRRTASA